jgi:hypothetical protein
VALQGTLDSFALADVLRLLASTHKTGRLRVEGPRDGGSLWFVDGAVVTGETGDAGQQSPAYALFDLQRLQVERFEFVPDDEPPEAGDPVDVDTVIADADERMRYWLELTAVVPSLDLRVGLVDDLPTETIEVDRDRWRLLTVVAGGTSVRRVGDQLGFDEFEVSASIKEMIEAGLVELGDEVNPAELDIPAGLDLVLLAGPHEEIDVEVEDRGSRDVALDVHAADHSYLVTSDSSGGFEPLPEPLPADAVSHDPYAAGVEVGSDPFGHGPLDSFSTFPSSNGASPDESRNGRGPFH